MRSSLRHLPFVKVNCAALPGELLESELFGFEQGAFTGAVRSKPGKFEMANKGTIFLDEIGDISAETQVKLLRVLQQREFEPVGGTTTIKVDVRLIAATHQNLERLITEKVQLQFARETSTRVDELDLDRTISRIAEANNLSLAEFRKRLEDDGVPFNRFREDLRKEIIIDRIRDREVDSKIQKAIDNPLANK